MTFLSPVPPEPFIEFRSGHGITVDDGLADSVPASVDQWGLQGESTPTMLRTVGLRHRNHVAHGITKLWWWTNGFGASECWPVGTANKINTNMLETSSYPYLPTTRFNRPPKSSSSDHILPTTRSNRPLEPPPQRTIPLIGDSSHHFLAKPPIRSSPMVFDIAKKEHGSTQWGLGIATSYHQILRARCFPPACRPSPLLDTNKGQLYQIWFSATAKQAKHHHFLLLAIRCANIAFVSTFRYVNSESHGRLSINVSSFLWRPHTCQRSLCIIRTTEVYFHKWSPTSLPLHRYRSELDLRRNKAWAKLGILGGACKHDPMRWSAGNGLSDWSDLYAGMNLALAIALMQYGQCGRCHIRGG